MSEYNLTTSCRDLDQGVDHHTAATMCEGKSHALQLFSECEKCMVPRVLRKNANTRMVIDVRECQIRRVTTTAVAPRPQGDLSDVVPGRCA